MVSFNVTFFNIGLEVEADAASQAYKTGDHVIFNMDKKEYIISNVYDFDGKTTYALKDLDGWNFQGNFAAKNYKGEFKDEDLKPA